MSCPVPTRFLPDRFASLWSNDLKQLPADFPPDLASQLVERGLATGDSGFIRMHGGRSNRVWRLSGPGGLVLKLFGTDDGNPMFANDAGLEQLAMQALDATGLAPRFVASGRVGQLPWILYRHVPGSAWSRGVDEVAGLLGRLHAIPRISGLPPGPNGSEDLVAQTQRILAALDPGQDRSLLRLQPAGVVGPSRSLSVIHRDPVPGNLVQCDRHLTLIDWQCPAIGDPAEDLAVFLSPAMQHLYAGAVLAQDMVERMLTLYPDPQVADRYRQLSPWFHWRMAAYCLWKVQAGDRDYRKGLELELALLERTEI